MHTKLLLVDGAVGIAGGRNYADDYYDWNGDYNFRDRDVLVAGPVAREMADNFDAFWDSRRSVPAEQLDDVGRRLLREGVPPLAHRRRSSSRQRVRRWRATPATGAGAARWRSRRLPVGTVEYLADLPQKHRRQHHGTARGVAGPARADRSAHSRSAAADAVPGAVEAGAGDVPQLARARGRRRA